MHPKARIIADAGPIIIGEGNLIEEQALIINRSFMICTYKSSPTVRATDWLVVLPLRYPENISPDDEVQPKTMVVGMNNVFEVGCGILF